MRLQIHWLKRVYWLRLKLGVANGGSTENSLTNAVCYECSAQGRKKKAHCVIIGLSGCRVDARHRGQIGLGWGGAHDGWSLNWKFAYSNYVQMGTVEWVNQSLCVSFSVHSCKTVPAHLSCFPTNSLRIVALMRTFLQQLVSLDALKQRWGRLNKEIISLVQVVAVMLWHVVKS